MDFVVGGFLKKKDTYWYLYFINPISSLGAGCHN
jgi:hypothetical protein